MRKESPWLYDDDDDDGMLESNTNNQRKVAIPIITTTITISNREVSLKLLKIIIK